MPKVSILEDFDVDNVKFEKISTLKKTKMKDESNRYKNKKQNKHKRRKKEKIDVE